MIIQKLFINLIIIITFLLNPINIIQSETSTNNTILSNSLNPLNISTYDGSGQILHPDVVYFRIPWKGLKYWMLATSHPSNNPTHYENPSIFVSKNVIDWKVPKGLTNPIAEPPVYGPDIHLSDPDMIYRPSYGLRIYYRLVDEYYNRILFKQSKDGKNWSSSQEIITLPRHEIISPAIIYINSKYIMYS